MGLLVFLGVVLASSLFLCMKELRIWGIFLKYSGKFISSNLRILMVMPIFLLLTMGLMALFLFQLLAYWSPNTMVMQPNHPYHRPESTSYTVMLTVLNFVWLYWGFSFLN